MCVLPVRWLVLDTDTRDLVSVHTDGNEIISNVKYSPGKTTLACITAAATVVLDAVASRLCIIFFFLCFQTVTSWLLLPMTTLFTSML